MKLSVIIVNYNVKYFLEQALVSVRRAMEGISGEVWVVDNNSVDGSLEMVGNKFPEVHIIANKDNVGFSRANNQAILQSRGEYVLLLNPDTVVEEDSFHKIVAFMDSHPGAGGLGVKMIDGEGKFLPESKRGLPTPEVAFYKIFGLSRLFPRSKRFGRYHLSYLSPNETNEADVLSGAFTLLRRTVLDKIGLLDETFFMYGEDIDLSYRITQAGYKNYYFADTTIIHYKGESTKKSSVNYVFVFYNAMIIFARKHYKGNHAGLFIFLINTAIYLRAFAAIISRIVKALILPLTDAAMIYGGMYLLKRYWEVNHRFVQGGQYPPEFMYINVTSYILIWLGWVWLNGGYAKRAPLRRIVRGVFMGTITIAVGYAFISDEYRFSRALIVLGAVWALVSMTGLRLLLALLRNRSLSFGEQGTIATVIVGRSDEVSRVMDLLQKTQVKAEIIGLVSPDEMLLRDERYLGTIRQLPEIASIYKIEEVIFCGRDVPAQVIIDSMAHMASLNLQYKIVPEESLYIIGSNSRDTKGDLYTLEIALNLADDQKLRIKRLMDIGICVLMLPLLPILLLFNRPGRLIANWARVLGGRMTWVGYAPVPHPTPLPPIRPGVLYPGDRTLDDYTLSKLNLLYAKNYTAETDLKIIINGLNKLGR